MHLKLNILTADHQFLIGIHVLYALDSQESLQALIAVVLTYSYKNTGNLYFFTRPVIPNIAGSMPLNLNTE